VAGNRATVYLGDTVTVLRLLAAGSVDSVATDPPYGLGFANQEWDGAKGFRVSLTGIDTTAVSDADLFEAWCHAWVTGALHVLKPGGYMAVFGGTRTCHCHRWVPYRSARTLCRDHLISVS
jgi:site-specific DNA-methyltransferase (adenine-specific)